MSRAEVFDGIPACTGLRLTLVQKVILFSRKTFFWQRTYQLDWKKQMPHASARQAKVGCSFSSFVHWLLILSSACHFDAEEI